MEIPIQDRADVLVKALPYIQKWAGKTIVVKYGGNAMINEAVSYTHLDQVRFELAIKAFAPEMKIIAPWRIWNLKSREEEIEYAEAHNIPLNITRETNYSKDKNIWHLSHEGLDLEDPANEPKYDEILELGVSPMKAPDKSTYVTLHFEKGVPTAIDGEKMDGVSIVKKLNAVSYTHLDVYKRQLPQVRWDSSAPHRFPEEDCRKSVRS